MAYAVMNSYSVNALVFFSTKPSTKAIRPTKQDIINPIPPMPWDIVQKKNEKKCMRCHSKPSLAPKDLINMYGDNKGFYEEEGYMRAILTTTVNIDEDISFANTLFLYLSFFTTLVFGIIVFVVHKFTLKTRFIFIIIFTNGIQIFEINIEIILKSVFVRNIINYFIINIICNIGL